MEVGTINSEMQMWFLLISGDFDGIVHGHMCIETLFIGIRDRDVTT